MPSLFDLYVGSGISSGTSKRIGSIAGATSSGHYFATKRKRVEEELASGRKTSQLSASDLAAVGLGPNTLKPSSANRSHGGSFLGGVGGFFGNLGKDIGDFATGLAPGIWKLGGAIGHDINPIEMAHSGKSQIYSDIIKPMIGHYKQTYFSGNLAHNLYEHPLGPILDAATLASGGASAAAKVGQVAEKAGNTGRLADLANVTSREGRPSISLPNGRPIEREYTPRPLAKAGQIGLDTIGQRITPLGEFQARRAMQREAKLGDQEFKGTLSQSLSDTARPLVESGKDLDADESLAYSLAVQGVNTPERVSALQSMIREALNDPEKASKAEALGVPRAIIERRANIPERVQRLVTDPSFEPETQAKLQRFHRAWQADVNRGLTQLPIEPAVHEARIGMVQRALDKTDDVKPPDFKPGQIEPTYMPHVQASNFEVHVPREKLSKVVPFIKPGEEVIRPQKRGARTVETSAVTAQNIFVPRAQRYLADSSGDTFTEGLFRTDPKVFVEHAVRREKDLAERGFKRELVEQQAARDVHGEVLKFKNNSEFQQSGLAETHVLVNPEFPVAWFRAETNFVKQAGQIIDRLVEHGDEGANVQVLEKMINDLTDADAKAFMIAHWGAMKRPGVAVPRDFFEYQKKLAQVSDPFNNAAGRMWARFMHHWRNTILAYMPRWGLNTAIGSFLTNMVKGVVNPMDYVRGNQLDRQFLDEAGNVVTNPSFVARKMGAKPLDFASQRYEKLAPAGISLQGEAVQEMMEASMPGYQNALGINFPTQKLVAGVQHIEDFFRRGSFQQSLRKEFNRQGQGRPLEIDGNHIPGGHTGEALEGINDVAPEGTLESMGQVLSDHFEEVAAHRGNVPEMLQNPVVVKRALRDVNKFGYNYGALGPHERRYVRQMMPFYGWYKFVSTLMGKLPVEYPGRTDALTNLAQIGTDMQDELGLMPDWIRGSIILGINADGTIKYMPTRGMNPFATFFDPLQPGETLRQFSGMTNPVIQAGLQAMGYDTLTGDSVRVSPQSGAGRDFLGRLIDEKTGQVISPMKVQPYTRGMMGLLRSVPQYRLGEKALAGGASVYPEHVPFIQPRLLSPAPDEAPTSGTTALGLSMIGLNPRGYDLGKFQRLAGKAAKDVKKKNRNAIRKTNLKFSQP